MTGELEFQSALRDKGNPCISYSSSTSTATLIAFGGIAGRLGMPPFEFFNLTTGFDVNRIYVRDLQQAWYHLGLPGIAENAEGVAEYLESKVKKQQTDRVVVVGNSMGGYAAILFGCLLKADQVHAFSPQTFINRLNRVLHFDLRWREQIRRVYQTDGVRKELLDLRKFLLSSPNKTQFNIYFNSQHRLDRVHAVRLRSIPNVFLHPYEYRGHTLAKRLRDLGALENILLKSLGLEENS